MAWARAAAVAEGVFGPRRTIRLRTCKYCPDYGNFSQVAFGILIYFF
jgi:hypothetical protein